MAEACSIPLWRAPKGSPRFTRATELAGFALVDPEDYLAFAHFGWPRYRWLLSANGYVVQQHASPGGRFALHRLVLGLDQGDEREGDHINGDRLDNRRANLRIVTAAQNKQNQPRNCRRNGGTSRYRGVCLSSSGTWQAQIWMNGKSVHLGNFATEEEAAKVAADARARHFSHFNPEREGASVA